MKEEMRPDFERLYRILFWIVLMLAILFRLPFLGADRMWPDEALYAWYAKQIFAHPLFLFSGDISLFHPPLFALLLSIGHFFLPSEQACRIVVFLINILGVVGVYVLGTRIKGRFLGCLAALAIGFNPLYFNQSFHILIDGVLAVGVIMLLLALADSSSRRSLWVSLTACVLILLKWPGALVVPFLIIYYGVTSKSSTFMERLKDGAMPILLSIVVSVLLLTKNFLQFGHIFPDTTALCGIYLAKPFWYYAVKFHNIIMVPFLIPFFFMD